MDKILDQETLMRLLVDYGYGVEEYLYHYPLKRCVSTSLNLGDYDGFWELATKLAGYCSLFNLRLPDPCIIVGSQGIRVYWPSMDEEELFPQEEFEKDWDDLED